MSNHPIIKALKDELKKELDNLSEECASNLSYYYINGNKVSSTSITAPDMFDSYKSIHEAATERLMALLTDAIDVIEFYGAKYNWQDTMDIGIKEFGPWSSKKYWTDLGYEYAMESEYDEGKKAREFLTTLANTAGVTLAGEIKDDCICGEINARHCPVHSMEPGDGK